MTKTAKIAIISGIIGVVLIGILVIASHSKKETTNTYIALDVNQNGYVSKELLTNGKDSTIYVEYVDPDGETVLYELTDKDGNTVTFDTLKTKKKVEE